MMPLLLLMLCMTMATTQDCKGMPDVFTSKSLVERGQGDPDKDFVEEITYDVNLGFGRVDDYSLKNPATPLFSSWLFYKN
jgi:hypothetical protein